MSKRGPTRTKANKVKKRRGVGSRTISVPDSDEDPLPVTTNDYARITKTRVGTAGKAEKVVTSSIHIYEADWVDVHDPPEADTHVPAVAVTKNVAIVVPAKRRKRGNDSVSDPTSLAFGVAKKPSDQDAHLAQCTVHLA